MLLSISPVSIPSPLPAWASTLLELPPGLTQPQKSLLEYIGELFDAEAPAPTEWRHVQTIWERNGQLEVADRMVTTFDIVNITGGQADPTWTDADYTNVEAALRPLFSTWLSNGQVGLKHVETRYYRRWFNAMTNEKPFAQSGPPDRVFLGVTGVPAGDPMPNQVAFTTTEKTAYPKHWGRNYWPLPSANKIDASGYINSASCVAFVTALHDAYAALQAAGFFPVIPVTQIDNQASRGLLTVTQVQMDNVPDVVRRRRLHTTTNRAFLPAS